MIIAIHDLCLSKYWNHYYSTQFRR